MIKARSLSRRDCGLCSLCRPCPMRWTERKERQAADFQTPAAANCRGAVNSTRRGLALPSDPFMLQLAIVWLRLCMLHAACSPPRSDPHSAALCHPAGSLYLLHSRLASLARTLRRRHGPYQALRRQPVEVRAVPRQQQPTEGVKWAPSLRAGDSLSGMRKSSCIPPSLACLLCFPSKTTDAGLGNAFSRFGDLTDYTVLKSAALRI